MRCVIALGLSAVASFVATAVHADTLRKESFEGCTGVGYALMSGAFGGTVDDGIECGPQPPVGFPFALSPVTGQDGNHYIGLEQPSDVPIPNPNAVVLTDIDIVGYENLGLSLLFAAPSAALGRYETNDYLEAQYRVDDGPSWVTVGRFIGAGAGVVGMSHDVNLDGSVLIPVTSAMQRFAYTLDNRAGQGTVTGSTLSVRIMFSSDGPQEEMAFDDIIVTGDPAGPIMNLSADTYSVNEDGSPAGAAVVIERSGSSVGATNIDLSFTSGSAVGGSVDFDATTMTVAFADGETFKTIELPITDDDIDEEDETFAISLSTNSSNAVVGSASSATITILDDDTAGVSVLQAPLPLVKTAPSTATLSCSLPSH